MADDLKNKFVASTSKDGLKNAIKKAVGEGYKKSGPVRRQCLHFRDNIWRLVFTQKMIVPAVKKQNHDQDEIK